MNSSQQENQTISGKKVSRRGFLKAQGAGVAVLAGAKAASAKDSSKGKRLAMVIDLQHCTGCGGCVISCKSENNVQRGNTWASMKTKTVGKFPNVRFEAITTLCNHCENAPTSSPREVTEKVKGYVIPYYNDAREKSTPGSGLRYKGIVEKCTLCDHRVKKGLLPHCVLSCPCNARVMGDLNDPNSAASKLLAKYRPWRLKEHLGTEPKVFYVRSFNPGASISTKGSV
jgi:molybdopterin-containing oxidoreductase family iron-sulfur binding subunit